MFPTHRRAPGLPLTQAAPAAAPSAGGAADRQYPVELIPAAHFLRHDVAGDGDCLFRAVHLALIDGARPDSQTQPGDIRRLRDTLVAYIDKHFSALSNNPLFFENNDLLQLRELVARPRQWANNAGDVVPILLAHVLGRELKILMPLDSDPERQYFVRETCTANNPDLPAVAAAAGDSRGGESVSLLYTGLNHYSYLRPSLGDAPVRPAPLERDELLASEILLSLQGARAPGDQVEQPVVDGRPRKKPKLSSQGGVRVKTEVGNNTKGLRAGQPPLVPFSVSIASGEADTAQRGDQRQPRLSQRFHISPNMALDRASRTQNSTLIPISWVSDADIVTMSQRPIIQHPQDPSRAHPSLPQPAQANMKSRLKDVLETSPKLLAAGVSTDLLKQVREQLNDFLQYPEQRQVYECTHFALSQIKPEHLPEAISVDHPTLGMRGVLAQQDLAAGSPLQYSGQYLSQRDWQAGVNELSHTLQHQSNLSIECAQQAAQRALSAYVWEGVTYKGKKYDISAFGAGNIASMINHDANSPNMGAAYFSVQDKQGQAAPKLMVYFALRDIAAGEQLLVDYGEAYNFDQPTEGSAILPSVPGHLLSNIALPTIATAAVKSELPLATYIDPVWSDNVADSADDSEAAIASSSAMVSSVTMAPTESSRATAELAEPILEDTPLPTIASLSLESLPPAWRQMPESYTSKTASQKVLMRCDYRQKIRDFYQEHKPEGTVLPDRIANEKFPQWCRPRLMIEKWQEPPADYSTLTTMQINSRKSSARKYIYQYNKDKNPDDKVACFKWCQPVLAVKSLSELLRAPQGFEQLTESQQLSKKSKRRFEIDKYNIELKKMGKETIPYPVWMRKTSKMIRDMSREDFIAKWAIPPAGYDQLNSHKKSVKNKSVRDQIDKYNEHHAYQQAVPVPLWCRKLKEQQARPVFDEKNTLPCPQEWQQLPADYGSSERRSTDLRYYARKKIDDINKKRIAQGLMPYRYANWFKERPNKVSAALVERMQPPAGYSTMSYEQKCHERDLAKRSFERLNKQLKKEGKAEVELPAWCKPATQYIRSKTLSQLFQYPTTYPSMTTEEQAATRAKYREAIDFRNLQREQQGELPVDYADWMQERVSSC